MKTSWLIIVLLVFAASRIQGQVSQSGLPAIAGQGTVPARDTPYAVVDRGANHRVWQRTTYETRPDGKQIPHIHKYTELATGLNYWNSKSKQWVESKEQIDILPNGTAVANHGQHTVTFPGDIYSGVIELVTPDGIHLQSRPLGLSYDDGNTVLIAELKDSVGQLVGSNQVIYPDAFTGVRADLVMTYRRSGFESDVMFREQIPDPESLGLGPNARLQLLTEFFNPPEPVQKTSAASKADGLTDTTLRFGSTIMGPGKAFAIGGSSGRESAQTDQSRLTSAATSRTPVYKSWLQLQGRTFLIEELPYRRISAQLQTLPVSASAATQAGSSNSVLHKVSAMRLLPSAHFSKSEIGNRKSEMIRQLTKADIKPKPGVVLDYVTINSGETNYTFQGDTTYYVSGEYNLSGTTTLEGGSVVKMNGSGQLDIDQNGTIVCNTGPYRPAVFTSANDNSVGEQFGSGSPAFGDVWIFLSIDATNASLHDLRFSYSWVPINQGWGSSPAVINVWNCQFEDVDVAVFGYNIGLHNVLIGRSFINSDAAVFVEGTNMVGENVTADGGSTFLEVDGSGATVALTNCLVTGQPLITGNPVALLTNATVWLPSPSIPVYQTVGAGSYYLTNDSPYRNAGTTNINSTLLATLKTKTTYPPIIYSNITFSVATTFSPQAQRDTDMPDLGYHYDPLDYIFGSVDTSTNLTFTAGTAVGWFDHSGYGISLTNSITINFNGTVTAPCIFTHYTTVQEGNAVNWAAQSWFAFGMAAIGAIDDPNYAPLIMAQFTHFSQLASTHNYFRDYTIQLHFQGNDCEFYNGGEGGYGMWLCPTNCLFDRVYLGLQAECCAQMAMQNCTLHGGYMLITHWGDWPVTIINSAFDGTIFDMDASDAYCDYNAFLTNANLTAVMGGHEVTNLVSYNWQSNWLGNYYLPTNSPLIDMGNTNANLLGLYHFTTQTNQVKETNSIVDIGYHYVAVDGNGNPIDTNGDGIPDYLEDANGNGIYDNGDINDWTNSDSDSDGLPDWWERKYFGNLSQTGIGDPDGDGWSNWQEYLNGTNPTSADQPFLILITQPWAGSIIP